MNNRTIKISMVQQANTGDVAENLLRLKQNIRQGAANGAELIVLQELHNTLYPCQTQDPRIFDQAESIPGRSTAEFGALAAELKVVLVLSLFERVMAGLYFNTAVVLESNGQIAGTYRKMHIPDDPAYYEKFYFTPGDAGFKPIQTSLGSLGVLVCWDQWYPEAARLMALAGAEILIYPTAIGWESSDTKAEQERQLDAWITAQRAHGISNGIPVVSVNRTGYEPDPSGVTGGIQFWGSSFIAGPQGELIATASADKEEVVTGAVDMGRIEAVRRIWPFFRDRRIDAFAGLQQRSLIQP